MRHADKLGNNYNSLITTRPTAWGRPQVRVFVKCDTLLNCSVSNTDTILPTCEGRVRDYCLNLFFSRGREVVNAKRYTVFLRTSLGDYYCVELKHLVFLSLYIYSIIVLVKSQAPNHTNFGCVVCMFYTKGWQGYVCAVLVS